MNIYDVNRDDWRDGGHSVIVDKSDIHCGIPYTTTRCDARTNGGAIRVRICKLNFKIQLGDDFLLLCRTLIVLSFVRQFIVWCSYCTFVLIVKKQISSVPPRCIVAWGRRLIASEWMNAKNRLRAPSECARVVFTYIYVGIEEIERKKNKRQQHIIIATNIRCVCGLWNDIEVNKTEHTTVPKAKQKIHSK